MGEDPISAATTTDDVPTLYEWAGGADALRDLFERFDELVRADELIGPLFAEMDPQHGIDKALTESQRTAG